MAMPTGPIVLSFVLDHNGPNQKRRFKLDWTSDGVNVSFFYLYRCSGYACTDWAFVQFFSSITRTTVQTAAAEDTYYRYKIVPVGSGGEFSESGPPSNIVRVLTGKTVGPFSIFSGSMVTPASSHLGAVLVRDEHFYTMPAEVGAAVPTGAEILSASATVCYAGGNQFPLEGSGARSWVRIIAKPVGWSLSDYPTSGAGTHVVLPSAVACVANNPQTYDYPNDTPITGDRSLLLDREIGWVVDQWDESTPAVPRNFISVEITSFTLTSVDYGPAASDALIDNEEESITEPCCAKQRAVDRALGNGVDPIGVLPPWTATCIGGGQPDNESDLSAGEAF